MRSKVGTQTRGAHTWVYERHGVKDTRQGSQEKVPQKNRGVQRQDGSFIENRFLKTGVEATVLSNVVGGVKTFGVKFIKEELDTYVKKQR